MINLWRWIYSLILYLLVPLALGRLLWRSLGIAAYRQRISERFGFGLPVAGVTLWIHAVSVGEVQAALPLINALRARPAGVRILITTTTPTGAHHVQAALGSAPQVIHRYAPYDLPDAVQRFLTRTQPQFGIIMETELWPNLIHACRQRGIPIILANARLSERSARRYRYCAALVGATLRDFSVIAAQSAPDAARFQALGAAPERLCVTGNLKFDFQLPENIWETTPALRRELGEQRPIWIAASTHEGEEELILAAHAELSRIHRTALLLLVPRHPERFQRVAALCRRMGFPPSAWSDHAPVPAASAVYLGDTMGKLLIFYAVADIAFVGGSLVPVGGHNPLEAAALGKAVIFGQHCFNFQEVNQLLLDAGAARLVRDGTELAATLAAWLEDAQVRHAAGARGRAVVAANRGALRALVDIVEKSGGSL